MKAGRTATASLRETLDERMRILGLVSTCRSGWIVALLVVEAAVALAPTIDALVTGFLVGSVAGTADQPEASRLIWPLTLFAVVLVLGQVGQSLRQLIATDVSRQVDGHIRKRARDLLLDSRRFDLLEDREIQDDIARASDLGRRDSLTRSPGAAVIGQVHLLFRVLGGLAAAAVLARFSITLAGGLFVAALAMRAMVRRHYLRLSSTVDALAPQQRRAQSWLELGTGAHAAKEIRIFGLADWLAEVQGTYLRFWWLQRWQEARRLRIWQWPVTIIGLLVVFAVLAVVGSRASDGSLSLAELATSLIAVWGVLDLSGIGAEPFQIEYGATAVRALERLRARVAAVGAAPSRVRSARQPDRTIPKITFENVSFRYPGTGHDVLSGFDLSIEPGEVLGIVGDNGAGKTTLIKLLAGLYRPTEGRVTADDIDLAELDPDVWRRRLTVLFQDFVRYPESLGDNIRLSAPEVAFDADELHEVLATTNAAELLRNGEMDLSTSLWRGGDGRDLSGGQWQRLAIARTVFASRHARSVVVMDEPTAHLDVLAEADFYQQVITAVPDATIVLISHRFATLRRADRIVLLQDGRVAEDGSHDELLAAGGEYARLFRLQADRFTVGDPR